MNDWESFENCVEFLKDFVEDVNDNYAFPFPMDSESSANVKKMIQKLYDSFTELNNK